ncbi:MAG TPA: hypothetical protein EYG50_02925 [Cycloclasticus sp.]|jgi:hypothetical protein|nr:hypothetical protein [Cycloclasticus sp.]
MAELRPSILFSLLGVGGILLGLGLIYAVFYDSEKIEGNRYKNSYVEFDNNSLNEKQQQAISFLKGQGIEWANYRFMEAIKNDDMPTVQAFIDAGMRLNSSSIFLEIALGASTNKKNMLVLLNQHYPFDLNALYTLPNYVTVFDKQLASVSKKYIDDKKEQYRLVMGVYKRSHTIWENELAIKKREMLQVCQNDACRSGRINDARRLFASTEPKAPKQDYMSKERVNLSLLTLFVWQNDQPLIQFIKQQGMELIPNKLFLTDGKLLYFTVDEVGQIGLVEPVK